MHFARHTKIAASAAGNPIPMPVPNAILSAVVYPPPPAFAAAVLVGDSVDHDVENLLIQTVVGGSVGLGCTVVEFDSPAFDADPASRSQYPNTKTRDHSRATL
jgi:hypothetical protein